jgi:ubiquinone/menaquinone biosynthesis C-methylase UbiE
MADADNGWDKSAAAWIASLGDEGDFARRGVLDPRMREAALAVGGRFLDIGCGEGRFVRMLGEAGLSGCGIDPTEALVDAARERDPAGEYHIARAEALPFADAMFDLAVFYLSLIDIDDLDEAIGEAVRVLRPGGSVLIANLSPINTAGSWQRTLTGH